MSKAKPLIQLACICERLLQEPDKVISAIRIVDVVTLRQVLAQSTGGSPAPPVPSLVQVLDFIIAVALKAGDLKGNFTLSLVMEDPKGQRVPILTDSPVVLEGDDGVNAVVRFGLPHNAPEGRYWFDVVWGGELLTRIPFRLKREEELEAPAQVTG